MKYEIIVHEFSSRTEAERAKQQLETLFSNAKFTIRYNGVYPRVMAGANKPIYLAQVRKAYNLLDLIYKKCEAMRTKFRELFLKKQREESKQKIQAFNSCCWFI